MGAAIQEAPFRTQPGLKGCPARLYSSWRGTSLRKYSVELLDVSARDLFERLPCVGIAALRDADGFARRALPPAQFESGTTVEQCRAWIDRAVKAKATELHLHRTAAGPVERADVVEDLK